MKGNKYIWKTKTKEIISCDEKLKILNENLIEIENLCQGAMDDAILMGCDEKDFKSKVIEVIKNSKFSFSK
jgi:DNA-directed RNA polymerase subunit H (RpoH/RPB5)